MGKKRKYSEVDKDYEILRQLRKLEKKIRKRRHRSHSSSSESESKNHNPNATDLSEPELLLVDEELDNSFEREDSSLKSNIIEPLPSTSLQDPLPDSLLNLEDGVKDLATVETVPLDDDILSLLGDPPKEECPMGKDTHVDIAQRLEDILKNGIKKEIKDKIIEDYPIPGNCQLFKAPELNPEIKAAISDILLKKDISLALRQGQIGVALTALTRAMDILVSDKSETSQAVLKHVSNASRLLCDSHFIDTKMRRNFLISTLNNKIKDTLKETKRDKNLFGESLSDKLKATKAITRSSQELKYSRPKPNYIGKNNPSTSNINTNNLNWKRPQSNGPTQKRKATSTMQRTAGLPLVLQRNENTRRQPPPRARNHVPYKNQLKH